MRRFQVSARRSLGPEDLHSWALSADNGNLQRIPPEAKLKREILKPETLTKSLEPITHKCKQGGQGNENIKNCYVRGHRSND
jgi:hypothetical protein